MPLVRARPPAGTLRLIRRRLPGAQLIFTSSKYVTRSTGQGRRAKLSRPRRIGWQHVVVADGRVYRVTTVRRGRRQILRAISAGAFADAAAEGYAFLARTTASRRVQSSVASLTIPTLMTQMLWIKSQGRERYWVLRPSHSLVETSQLLTRRQLLASLSVVTVDIASHVSEAAGTTIAPGSALTGRPKAKDERPARSWNRKE